MEGKGWLLTMARPAELPKTLKVQAYSLIKAAILNGDIASGVVFSQDQLSQWLGISRTPVREALLELQNEGLVRMLRGRGIEVIGLTATDAREIIEIRKGLEGHAGELAAANVSPELMAQLESELSSLVACSVQDKRAEFLESDRAFHRLIVKAAGNNRMLEIVEALRDQFMRVGMQALTGSEEMEEVVAEHQRILAALHRRDAAGTRAAMLQHLQRTAERFLETDGGQPPQGIPAEALLQGSQPQAVDSELVT
jgi:DNA-binding GntR family transcriptional regulator